jgi:hypothetical protein
MYHAELQRYRFLELKSIRLAAPFFDEERSREIACRALRKQATG